jgi:ribosomal protein S18 acetylase RimI-like enzyme
VQEVRAAGYDALMLATALLQRARLADPEAGIWDAADVQWWWRKPRLSERVEQLFVVDAQGPVAGVLLTSWTDERWQCDPIIVPRASPLEPEALWERALEEIRTHAQGRIEVPVPGNAPAFRELAVTSGLTAGERSSTAWMDAADRPSLQTVPEGFTLVDRARRSGTPHPMRRRNGDSVEERLRACPLYDPELDLAVEASDGRIAGYSLYWFDPATKVGLVEPVRVEDDYQRRGLARSMLTEGLSRLASRGAQRVKIGYETEAAGALYRGIGFQPVSADTWYEGNVEQLT